MKINNIKKVSFWIPFISFQTLFACSRHNQQIWPFKGTAQPSIAKEAEETQEAYPEPTHNQVTFGVVLLHGLTMDIEEMEYLEDAFSERYKEKVLLIKPRSREGNKSVINSMDYQTSSVYQEIVEKLEAHHKNTATFPLFIFGQSQGGLIAVQIAKQYNDELCLLTFFTHHTPLKGADILTRTPIDVRRFARSATNGLDIIGAQLKKNFLYKGSALGVGTRYTIFPWLDRVYKTGLSAILPNSACTQSIASYLRNSQPSPDAVPGVLLAGDASDFSNLFSETIKAYKDMHKSKENIDETVNQAIQSLNQAVATFVTGDKHGAHDHLIPTKSQLCRGDSLEDLSSIGDQPYQIVNMPNPNITGYVIKDVPHCPHLFPISGKAIDSDESMMSPRRMLPLVFETIDKKLANHNRQD